MKEELLPVFVKLLNLKAMMSQAQRENIMIRAELTVGKSDFMNPLLKLPYLKQKATKAVIIKSRNMNKKIAGMITKFQLQLLTILM
jgi:hypothetical protein